MALGFAGQWYSVITTPVFELLIPEPYGVRGMEFKMAKVDSVTVSCTVGRQKA